jgi:DNA-binding NarL/FixJ family response regulator
MSNGIGIATDSPILADMFLGLLPGHCRGAVVYSSEGELLAALAKGFPRIIFMENTFEGLGTEECIRRLTRRYRSLRITVWTTALMTAEAAARFIASGSESFINLRDTGEAELKTQIETILSGKAYYSADIERVLEADGFLPDYRGEVTDREAEIIRHILRGHSNRAIAGMAGIELSTVKTHKSHIHKKCGGKGYAVLLPYALAHGIISLDELGDQKHDRKK